MAEQGALARWACPPPRGRVVDLGILGLRAVAGGLLAGHGAQKLFGAFGGHGLAGTAGWLESMGLRPGKTWAALAGLSEFGGGLLTALGLGGPLGPIALQGAMATAIRKAHWGKPIWVSSGGGELPLVHSTVGLSLALTGPGRYSLDHAFGIRVPFAVSALAAAGVVGGIVLAERVSHRASQPAEATEAPGAHGTEDQVAETPAAPALEGENRLIAQGPATDSDFGGTATEAAAAWSPESPMADDPAGAAP